MASLYSRRVIFGVALAVTAMGTASGNAQMSIEGRYSAEGRNPDGSAYSGIVQIVQSGDAISMSWQIGDQAYSGSGVRQGRIVTVNWGAKYPVIYVIQPNGALHGTWADGRALERLTR